LSVCQNSLEPRNRSENAAARVFWKGRSAEAGLATEAPSIGCEGEAARGGEQGACGDGGVVGKQKLVKRAGAVFEHGNEATAANVPTFSPGDHGELRAPENPQRVFSLDRAVAAAARCRDDENIAREKLRLRGAIEKFSPTVAALHPLRTRRAIFPTS
jgi:hypothetical protein